MSGFNMPPGVSPSDIPGNGPEPELNVEVRERDRDEDGIWYEVVVNGFVEDTYPDRDEAQSLADAFVAGDIEPVVRVWVGK